MPRSPVNCGQGCDNTVIVKNTTNDAKLLILENKLQKKLTEDLTSAVDIGGIKAGDTYEAGTSLEEILRDILSKRKTLKSITIASAPTKVSYIAGQLFDTAGMIVTANYNDDTSEVITNYTYSPIGALTVNDTQITISYTEEGTTKTTTQAITVEPVAFTSISITTAPTKVAYIVGESFNKAGMVVNANYNDGSSKVITNYTYSPTGALTVNDTQITVSYTEGSVTKTAVQVITVSKVSLSSIVVSTPPTKIAYTAGEVFAPAGMVITARYNDGTSKVVSNYTYSPTGALTTSVTKITISYTEDGVTKTTTQAITVTVANVKVYYGLLDELPTSSAEVEALTLDQSKDKATLLSDGYTWRNAAPNNQYFVMAVPNTEGIACYDIKTGGYSVACVELAVGNYYVYNVGVKSTGTYRVVYSFEEI